MMRALLLVFILGVACPARAAFESIGSGARAPGMGGAFTALSDDVYAMYYNPAGLAQLERSQVSASYAKLFSGLNDGSDLGLSQLAYAHPFSFGEKGTLGLGWQRFALGGLYTEQTIHLSYGRTLHSMDDGSRLLGGVNLKYLTRSFGSTPEANNACLDGSCTGNGDDPVLAGQKSKSTPDIDLGFIYRLPKLLQLGLMIEHVMTPDVGFSSPDKLPRNIHTGVAYKSLWMNLNGELQLNKAPDGTTDKDIVLAAERYFPTLDYGQFGVRGSLGFGSRDWKELTMGGSYRVNKIQFDYAFLMPIGSFGGDTHRLAMTLHFGAPNPEEEISREVLEKARALREGRAAGKDQYGYEFQSNMRPQDLNDDKLADIRRLIFAGQYRQAQQRLTEMMQGQPSDPALDRLAARLDAVAYFYPEFVAGTDRWEIALSTSANYFLRGKDRLAMLHGSYAVALNPSDVKLDRYLQRLEKDTGIKADRIPADSNRSFIDDILYRVEGAHNRGDNQRVMQLLRDLLELEPGNVTALERLGSAYYLSRQYPEALDAWERALPLETKPAEVDALRQYIQQARDAGNKGKLPGGVTEPAPAPQPAAPAVTSAPRKGVGDPRDVAALYQKGVEHYARGEYLQATAMFMRILQIDPQNAQARKALDRIQRASNQ